MPWTDDVILIWWSAETLLEPDAPGDEREYSEDGIDLTLIWWMLSLTPAERLAVLESFVNSVLEIRARNGQA